MRTPEDIAKAQATYNDILIKTELSSLPDGYIGGGTIELNGADVFIAPFVANVGGKRVVKSISTNIMDMDWEVLKTNSTYFHIYLNRYGFWSVNTNEPVTVDGKYGLYQKESNERYMGTVYVDSSGSFSKVISWKKIRAEDLDVGSITADEIEAGSITATEISADALQTMFLDVTDTITIGYEGTGTIDSPDEGDSRHYFNRVKSAIEEYTGGNWSAANGIKIGGLDSNGNVAPFITCRGVINPLADEVNTEFFPGGRIVEFENNTQDQYGVVADAEVTMAYTTSWKKNGVYSMGSANISSAEWQDNIDFTNSMSFSVWVYLTISDITTSTIGGFRRYKDTSNETTMYLRIDTFTYSASNEYVFYIDIYENIAGVATTTRLESNRYPMSNLNSFETYVSLTWNPDNSAISLTVGNDKYELTKTITQPSTYVSANTYFIANTRTYTGFSEFIDELYFNSSDSINPDIFIQHYNHDVPWNTGASAKDLILKPATGGNVVISGPLNEGSITITGSATIGNEYATNVNAATATITLPSGLSIGTRKLIRKINSGAGTITINASGTETFTRAALTSVTLTSDGDFWELEKVSASRWELIDGVESGSNSNETWTKKGDGSQNLLRSDSVPSSLSITFAKVFYTNPLLILGIESVGSRMATYSGISTTGATLYVWNDAGVGSTETVITQAIGRWYA